MTSNAFSAERVSFPEARSRSIKTCWTASRRSASLTWLVLQLKLLVVPGHHSPPQSPFQPRPIEDPDITSAFRWTFALT